jgi:two-component system, sensor histidine kinase and response regulator
LAEDNEINQIVALHKLKELGYTVDVVADGQLAVAALAAVKYDLVLMDCNMPNMNGFEAAAVIRSQSSGVLNHEVPIIAMTANAMQTDHDKCLEAGMNDFVSKPVKKEVLAAILNKWLISTHPLRRKTIDGGKQSLDKLKSLTVLYVEDDDDTREQYSRFLSRMVGVLITAKDGAEGLAAYHLHHPDIIITDIKMPVMDGLEMLKQVHTLDASIPAIVLSAFKITEDQRQSGNLGELRHEMKPVSGTRLQVTLLECADGLRGDRLQHGGVTAPAEIGHVMEFPEAITGIDIPLGLQHAGGRQHLFLTMLHKFRAGHKDTTVLFRQALEADDRDTAERLAHTIKGVAGNIGALCLEECARALESALRERSDTLESTIVQFDKALNEVIFELETKVPAQPDAIPVSVDSEQLGIIYRRLVELSANDNMAAVDLFESHGNLFIAAFPQEFSDIQVSLNSCDFETAVEHLERAMKRYNEVYND